VRREPPYGSYALLITVWRLPTICLNLKEQRTINCGLAGAFCATTGHWWCLNSRRDLANGDAGGGSVYSIKIEPADAWWKSETCGLGRHATFAAQTHRWNANKETKMLSQREMKS